MTSIDPRVAAWAYLSRVVEGPCEPLLELVAQVGPEESARAVRERDLPPSLAKFTLARRHVERAEDDLNLMHRLGGRLVTPDDDDWPSWKLIAFARRQEQAGEAPLTRSQDRLKLVGPLALWVLGRAGVAEVTDRAVAIVGTRAATGYGEYVAADFAGGLASQGWTIVSGGAYGIDAAAHRAALAVGGVTVAVLACGVDRAYPSGHCELLRQIAADGLVVSEYPPGISPAKFRFLTRNRLIAGLSNAAVVVEAGWRSGAINTATWAQALGRPVLAVPGPATSSSSAGCHRMIRDNRATLVTRAAEIVEAAGSVGELAPDPDGLWSKPTDLLSGTRLQVYEAFPPTGTRSVYELSELSAVSIQDVRAALPMLEIDGFAGSDGTGWYRATPPGRSSP